ncbi:hypothetical protein AGMMS50239_33590 [Bacteroidia bacterium]|nr:hypothetical protein AGMMS50239_33590 [Bacteroidia bacterium]
MIAAGYDSIAAKETCACMIDAYYAIDPVFFDMNEEDKHNFIKENRMEVEKIVISGFDKTDDFGNHHIPIYIYPFDNYVMRNVSGARYTTFEGYSAVKDFFGNQTNLEDTLLDGSEHQRTLYWNPNVKTDEAGKASVRFFNTGSGQKIDISAEGLTKNGIAVIKK